MKNEVDDKTIENMIDNILQNPDKFRKLMKYAIIEVLSILEEKKVIEEGAKFYREVTNAINETYKKE